MPETVECAICGTPSGIEDAFDDIHLHRCPGCDHCFTDISAAAGREGYDEDYFDEVHKNWFEHPNVFLFEFIERAIRAFKDDASVFDVGCGNGDLLRHLRRANPKLVLAGVDFHPNENGEGIRFLQGDAFEAAEEGRHDVVATLGTIEHIPRVREFTERLIALGGEDPLIVIMTINDRSLLYAVARFLRAVGISGVYKRLYSRHHVHHFNARSLERLVESSGLRIVSRLDHNVLIRSLDFPPVPAPATAVFKAGVWGIFALSRLFGGCYLQTILCRKRPVPG